MDSQRRSRATACGIRVAAWIPGISLSLALRSVGAIPSTYEAARSALGKGIPILLFPGGDHEALRPIWQANRIDLGGRLGFLRIAHQAGVPIVPLAIRGSHYTAPIVWRSRLLATLLVQPRLIGAKRWAVSLLGVMGAIAIFRFLPFALPFNAVIAFVWLGSPFAFLPWVPSKIRMRIGPPLVGPESSTDESLKRALVGVETAMQTLLDR